MRLEIQRGNQALDLRGVALKRQELALEGGVGVFVPRRHRLAEGGAIAAEAENVQGGDPFGLRELGEHSGDEAAMFGLAPFGALFQRDKLREGG